MSYELTGKLVAKYDTVQRTETFKTREFVVEKTDDINGRSVVNYVKFQCTQERTNIVDRVNTGDDIKYTSTSKVPNGKKMAKPTISPTWMPGESSSCYSLVPKHPIMITSSRSTLSRRPIRRQ